MTAKNKRGFCYAAVIAVSVILDQLTKQLATAYLKPIETFPIIRDALHLTYVTNYGAAFGILSDHRWVFLLISTVAIVLLACYLFEKRDAHPLLGTALSFIIGGGIGNMIDRIIYGYVVDFVDFRLINFAVFNVADMFVCIGCALMFLWIFRYADFDEKKKPDGTENKEGLSEESASPQDAETEGEQDDAAHR